MITGERVTLRAVEERDYPDIQRWQNDPEVFRWMDYEAPFTARDIAESEARATVEGQPFIIEVEGRAIGRIGLNNFRIRDRMASLYIFIGDRSAFGHGYGPEALRLLLRYAFEQLNLRKVELWTLADNDRAIHMYKSAGFVEDGRLPDRSLKEGRFVDHVVMSIDADVFRANDADRSQA